MIGTILLQLTERNPEKVLGLSSNVWLLIFLVIGLIFLIIYKAVEYSLDKEKKITLTVGTRVVILESKKVSQISEIKGETYVVDDHLYQLNDLEPLT